jgi:thiamine pyrophosphokinase
LENFTRIVHNAQSVTLLGDGAARETDLLAALEIAPVLICADGGGNRAMRWGHCPCAIVGDLDSANLKLAANKDILVFEVADQSTTDFEKCLDIVPQKLVLAVGFLGKRVDHQLAAFNALSKYRGQPIILIGKKDVIFRVPDYFDMNVGAGSRVSLFPMSQVLARSSGLKWALDGLDFAPNGQTGCSNAALGGQLSIRIDQGDMLGVLPRALLPNLVAALTG